MIGGEKDLDACGGFGEVRGLNHRGDNFLAVRTGARAQNLPKSTNCMSAIRSGYVTTRAAGTA